MSAEWEVVVGQFRESFKDSCDKRIIIYGVGKNTKAILDNCDKEFNIIGLMDPNREGEILWDKKVFSQEDLDDIKPDFIVIVARNAVCHIIYKRVEEKILSLKIPVYKVNGEELTSDNSDTTHECWSLKEAELIEKCKNFKVMSFDIFDTLIVRKTLFEADVFEIMSLRLDDRLKATFVKNRIDAQQKLRRNTYPTLDEIYYELNKVYHLNEKELDNLKKSEMECEKEVIVPRKRMIELINSMIDLGKEVILVSDMYLTADVIYDLLYDAGLKKGTKLFLSSEKKKGKSDGLFEIVLDEYRSSEIIHIGDDEIKDKIIPAGLGISTYRIFSAREMLCNSTYSKLFEMADNLNKRNMLGVLISDIFNNPFGDYESNGKINISSTYTLGRIIAPMITTYVRWTMQNAREKAVDEVLWVARDGYLPQQMYKIIDEAMGGVNPKTVYLYTSGRALTMARIDENSDMYILYEEYRGSTQSFVEDVLSLELSDDEKMQSIDEIVEKYRKEILAEAEYERGEYKRYIESAGIMKEKKYLYCDLFSKGTGQDNLEKLAETKFIGNYLHKSTSKFAERNNLAFETLFKASNHYEGDYGVFQNYSLIEYIISAPEGCMKKIENSIPVLFREDRTPEAIEFMLDIQKEITDYCKWYVKVCDFDSSVEDALFEDQILKIIGNSNIIKECFPRLVTYEWFRGNEKEAYL